MLVNVKGMRIVVNIENKKIHLPNNIQIKIEDFWKNVKKENPKLWNGELMCVTSCKIDKAELIITCKHTNYSHYLYDERVGLPNEYACGSLVAGCLLETNDGYYIVGELDDNTSYPYCLQLPGGSADNNDIKDGKLNIFNTIEREIKEELNVDLKDKNKVNEYEIKYISLPNENAHTYILFAKAQLKMSKQEMERYYKDYLQKLVEINGEIEFGRIHFIKKGNSTRELQQLENPKREYLVDLLEIDSKNIELER